MEGNAVTGFTITGRLGLQNTAPIIGWVRRASFTSTNPVPSISQLQPNSVLVGSAPQTLSINGSGFLDESTVTIRGVTHADTFVSSNQITIWLGATDLAEIGTFPIAVINPGPGGGSSNTLDFTINNPVPSISSLSPSTLPAGSNAQTLTINGTGFVRDSSVTFNGAGKTATFVSANQIAIPLSTSDVSTAGSFSVVITNPGPGGGTSAAVNLQVLSGQTNATEWTWMGGSDTTGANGVYGTQGSSSPSNVPGARDDAVSWTDSKGNLWLFGGEKESGGTPAFNDLWEFSPATNQWTWVSGSDTTDAAGSYGTQGIASSSNVPPARSSAVGWIDSGNNLWLFGGYGNDGTMNDLWEFNTTTKLWTWINGSSTAGASAVYGTKGVASSSNNPGARFANASWIDQNGNLWLLGAGGNEAIANDLWEFSPATRQWTWISGSSGGTAVFGTKGVASSNNTPGPSGALSWTDHNGNFWLFGTISYGFSNDLWEFSPSTKEWVWISGSNTGRASDSYGTQGVPSVTNVPGNRLGAVGWVNSNGKLFLFGGQESGSGYIYVRSDLWEFDPTNNEWTWISGNKPNGQNCTPARGVQFQYCVDPGTYGALGVPNGTNLPGGRAASSTWIDNSGDLWLFGGIDLTTGLPRELNDLWRYQP